MGRTVGIDLGTTFSLIAYMDPATNSPKCIPGPHGSTLCPSVVSVDEDGKVIVGEPARQRLLTQADRTIYSVKRLMGRGVTDVQDELRLFPFHIDADSRNVIRVRLGDKLFTAPEISAFILRELKSWAEDYFKEPVDRAVITVPAYFNDAQHQATKDAGRIAGLEVLRLVNEPTAAALAYGLDKQRDGLIAVYDFGGGTFDISILKLHEGIFEVIATGGDTHLGGDDIDNLLIAIALDDIAGDAGTDLRRDAEAIQAIRKAVIEAKIELSSQPLTQIDIKLPQGGRYRRELSREQFEQLIQPIVARTIAP